MTYLLIALALIMAGAGIAGVVHHDNGGIPFLIIGVGLLIWIGIKSWPRREPGSDDGE